jgi:WD40 repeat protein
MDQPFTFTAHASHINDVCFTRDSQILISAGMDNLVKLWSAPDWNQVGTVAGHEKSVNGLSLTPGNDVLVTASSDKTVRLWSFPDGQLLSQLEGSAGSAVLSPDGAWLAVVSPTRLKMISFAGLSPAWEKSIGKREIFALVFSPDSRILVTAGLQSEVSLYASSSGERLGVFAAHDPFTSSLAFTPDGRYLATTGSDGLLKIWSTRNWTLRQSIELQGSHGILAISAAPDADTLAISMDHQLVLASVQAGTIVETVGLDPKGVYRSAFSPDGKWLALGSADKKLRIWAL